jgi:uncharacterized protein (DUF427 family)
MPRAIWEGTVLAESDACVVVEGNQYFPRESVHSEYLAPSEHISVCPWKGTALYYDVVVGGKRNENAAWYYPAPSAEARQIENRIAFWNGVRVVP